MPNDPSTMLPLYAIVPGRLEHIARLNDIERSAPRLLEGYAPESVLCEITTAADFRTAITAGLL